MALRFRVSNLSNMYLFHAEDSRCRGRSVGRILFLGICPMRTTDFALSLRARGAWCVGNVPLFCLSPPVSFAITFFVGALAVNSEGLVLGRFCGISP